MKPQPPKMSFNDVMDENAKTSRNAKPKSLRSIEVEIGEKGGHTVMHRFKSSDGYHEPEGPHVFGKGDGKKLIEHLTKHLGIEVKDDPDSAAGAAS